METEVRSIFETELAKRGILFSLDENGHYLISQDEYVLSVSLENIIRLYRHEFNPVIIANYVDQILSDSPNPEWEDVKSFVYFQAVASNYQFGDAFHETVTRDVTKILTFTDENERLITWITPQMLNKWNISLDIAKNAAKNNIARLLATHTIEIGYVDTFKLGFVPIASVYKAAVIFAPNFKEFVSSELGWPVIAMIPCRDFVFIISEAGQTLLPRLGQTIIREFEKSPYPITAEILRISDFGIESIGKYK